MAKVYPQTFTNSCYTSNTKQTFTVWLKSLIFHGNGCTVFNSDGDIVFRVDNYQQRCTNEVFIMDLNGDVLFSLKKQKVGLFGNWKGYKWNDSKLDTERPWIQIMKKRNLFGGNILSRRRRRQGGEAGRIGAAAGLIGYRLILGVDSKQEFKVVDTDGRLVAQVKRKQSCEGIFYGDDVLTLVVEANTDQLLILALMTVYGLINHKL